MQTYPLPLWDHLPGYLVALSTNVNTCCPLLLLLSAVTKADLL